MAKVSRKTKNPKALQLKGEFGDELAAFYEVGLYQRGVGDRSRYRYRAPLLRYQQFLGGRKPSPEASVAFLTQLRKSGFAPNTLRVYRSVLGALHEWRGEKLDFKIKLPRKKPPYVEEERVEGLLARAKDIKHRVAIGLMAFATLREGEVAGLTVGKVNLRADTMRVFGKGAKERIIPIPPRVRDDLARLCEGKRRNERVIGLTASGIYKLVTRLDPTMHPHLLRHYCISSLIERGADVRVVQEIAGHENLETTSVYAGLRPGRMREAMALLGGRPPQQQQWKPGEVQEKGQGLPSFPRDAASSTAKDPWTAASRVLLDPANLTGLEPGTVEAVQLAALPTVDRGSVNRLLKLAGKPTSLPPDPTGSVGQG